MIPSSPFLCVITDEAFCPVTLARKALEGGALMIQLRNKSASGNQIYLWALEISRLCMLHGGLCIINDRIDIALASRADGVHLGQADIPAAAARKLLGKNRILGISASSPAEALQAEHDGADYIGVGHIYPTASKEKSTLPIGPETLASIAALVRIPIVAIGGISIANAGGMIRLGASGVAVISAVSRTESPAAATRTLLNAIGTMGEHPDD
ncbi:MAG: thiamine phosphate synthase [Chlorobiaceae bacterium]